MKNVVWIAAVALLLVSLMGCTQPTKAAAAPPIQSVATLEEVMHNMIIPNAETVWSAVKWVNTAKGVVETAPADDDEWFDIESAATVLAESGNLLMMDGRAKDQTKWMERSKALREAADLVRQAAKKHDKDKLFTEGGTLFDACQGCHFEFRFEKDPKTIRTH